MAILPQTSIRTVVQPLVAELERLVDDLNARGGEATPAEQRELDVLVHRINALCRRAFGEDGVSVERA